MWRRVRGQVELVGWLALMLLVIALMRPAGPPEALERAERRHARACEVCSYIASLQAR